MAPSERAVFHASVHYDRSMQQPAVSPRPSSGGMWLPVGFKHTYHTQRPLGPRGSSQRPIIQHRHVPSKFQLPAAKLDLFLAQLVFSYSRTHFSLLTCFLFSAEPGGSCGVGAAD